MPSPAPRERVWEVGGSRFLGWASGTTVRPAKACGGLCVVCGGMAAVRLRQDGPGLGWGTGSPLGCGEGGTDHSLTWRNEMTVGENPFSALARQTPSSSCSSPPPFFLQSREKNRQSSLERVGPLQDLLPALSPPKEYQPAAYRSISFSEALEAISDTCPRRWVGRPAMCFHSSSSRRSVHRPLP